jgi:hypothetical protein
MTLNMTKDTKRLKNNLEQFGAIRDDVGFWPWKADAKIHIGGRT